MGHGLMVNGAMTNKILLLKTNTKQLVYDHDFAERCDVAWTLLLPMIEQSHSGSGTLFGLGADSSNELWIAITWSMEL